MISPTSAEPDASRIADDRLAVYLSGRREDDVVMWVVPSFFFSRCVKSLELTVHMYRRLLDSRDSKVNTATLHLINNVTRNSPARL